MAWTGEAATTDPATTIQAAILARPASTEPRLADAVRALAIDAVEAAQSGQSGVPMGMADAATALWTRALKFDAADPRWPDRDRFVLSAGHGAMLLYALLHLTGHAGMDADTLRRFRQLDCPATGHPEFGGHPAIEATTGPLGQGIATAVGMALAERLLAARFGRSLVDHRTWVIASDGDLMEGISHEAASLAGQLKLERLAVLWDDNTPDDAACGSDDQLKRFSAYGWATRRVDGHDPAQLAAAMAMALRAKKPTLIACRTSIGAAAAGDMLSSGTAQAARQAMGWSHAPFELPEALADQWHRAGVRGAAVRRAWLKRLARHPMRGEFERVIAGRLPDGVYEALTSLKAGLAADRPPLAGRQASQLVLEALVPAMPELLGGSADSTLASLTRVAGMGQVGATGFGGRYVNMASANTAWRQR